jgi:hypothetical protein
VVEKKAESSVPSLDQLDSAWDDEGEIEEQDLDAGWGDVPDDEPEEPEPSEPPGLSREEREARAAVRKERARTKAAAKKERRRARALAAARGQKPKQRKASRSSRPDTQKEPASRRALEKEDAASAKDTETFEPVRRGRPRTQTNAGVARMRRDWLRMGFLVALVVIAGGFVVFLVRR